MILMYDEVVDTGEESTTCNDIKEKSRSLSEPHLCKLQLPKALLKNNNRSFENDIKNKRQARSQLKQISNEWKNLFKKFDEHQEIQVSVTTVELPRPGVSKTSEETREMKKNRTSEKNPPQVIIMRPNEDNLIKQFSFDFSELPSINRSAELSLTFSNTSKLLNSTLRSFSEYDDEELAHSAPDIIKEEPGCMLILKKISEDPNFANEILFFSIQDNLLQLILDPFGSSVVCKLIDFLDIEKIEWIVDLITPVFYQICASPYGLFVVDKIIEKLRFSPRVFFKFNKMLGNSLVHIINDPNGNYIIQKYLNTISYPGNQFLYDIIISNFLEIALSKYGFCIVQTCFYAGNGNQRVVLVSMIVQFALNLITDPFGNLIIQFVFSLNDPVINMKLTSLILSNFTILCKQKYSSYVILKCLDVHLEVQELVVDTLCHNEQIILELIVDSFGHFIVQKALMMSRGQQTIQILKAIAMNVNKLEQFSFGKEVILELMNKYQEFGRMTNMFHKKCYIQKGEANMANSKYSKKSDCAKR